MNNQAYNPILLGIVNSPKILVKPHHMGRVPYVVTGVQHKIALQKLAISISFPAWAAQAMRVGL